MEYLKKFYDLLGSEHGKIRPLIIEDSLPVTNTLPNVTEINSTQGVLVTPSGVISIDNDKQLNLNGKTLMITGFHEVSDMFFIFPTSNNYRHEIDVLNAKKEKDRLILKIQVDPEYFKHMDKKNNQTKEVTILFRDLEELLSKSKSSITISDTSGETYQLFYKQKY